MCTSDCLFAGPAVQRIHPLAEAMAMESMFAVEASETCECIHVFFNEGSMFVETFDGCIIC
jgi:hypothetical protein